MAQATAQANLALQIATCREMVVALAKSELGRRSERVMKNIGHIYKKSRSFAVLI